MTKEEVAAMFSGKPVAPETPPEGKVEREVHGFVVDKETTEKLSNAAFQRNPQAAFADTIAIIGKIRSGTIAPELCGAFGHAILLARSYNAFCMTLALHGLCFTRDGYVVATVEMKPDGISLGLRQKALKPFDGGFSEQNLILLAKETAKRLEDERRGTELYIPRSPEDVATAILAAIESLPKED